MQQITILVKNDNGDVTEVSREFPSFSGKDVINEIERNLLMVKEVLFPELSEKLFEKEQADAPLEVGIKKKRNESGNDPNSLRELYRY